MCEASILKRTSKEGSNEVMLVNVYPFQYKSEREILAAFISKLVPSLDTTAS